MVYRQGAGAGLVRRLGRFTSSTFVPSDIAGLHFWWRADSGLTGTDPVTLWAGKVRGDQLDNSVGGTGDPALVASDSALGGQPSIEFDGNDCLGSGSPGVTAPPTPSGCTMALAFYHTVSVNNGAWFQYISNQEEIRQNGTTNQVSFKALNSGVALTTAAKHYVICTYDNASNVANIHQDGTAVTATANTNTVDTPSTTTLAIGARRTGSLPTQSRIAEALMWPRALGSNEISSIFNYFVARYGAL